MRAFKLMGALCATALMLGASKAEAGEVFATFDTRTENTVFYTSAGGTSTLSANTLANFSFDQDLIPGAFLANFTMSASTTALIGAPDANGDSGSRTQPGFSGFMQFTFGAALLLRVDFSGASLTALSSSGGVVFSIDNASVTYSSSVITGFNPPNSFTVSLQGVTPPFPSGPLTGQVFPGFSAAASGEFSTGDRDLLTGVPVPSSVALLLSAIPALCIGGYFYRRRLNATAMPMAV